MQVDAAGQVIFAGCTETGVLRLAPARCARSPYAGIHAGYTCRQLPRLRALFVVHPRIVSPGGLMALIAAGVGAVPVFQMGAADRVILVGLRNVTTGDTLDLGATGMNLLSTINRAVIISTTSFVEIAGSWVGTVITMPSGLGSVVNGVQVGDAGYLTAWGSAIN